MNIKNWYFRKTFNIYFKVMLMISLLLEFWNGQEYNVHEDLLISILAVTPLGALESRVRG